ncbi:helix-turn-helix domain-containing protein [Lacticaseibacillus parakribbianus]|uniref:helix-turn-helix domain-containing protein n=1 Tax=Lacticaseibacillus parakribbianus TaxID=2970927 RepID=UPI0021CB1F8A|nr:helix-turn-helix transcriptional regulator [Lacticaseibacillus parakribbianus]
MTETYIFDAQRIGQQIAAARKRLNLTQSALADQLNVSYQAVSNWERSQSLPDIDKYAQLAAVLQLPLTELLGSAKAEATVHIVEADAPLEPETLAQAAPVMKPAQVEHSASGLQLDLANLESLAPYLSSDTLAKQLQALEGTADYDAAVVLLAPFLAAPALDAIVDAKLASGQAADIAYIGKLAPFLTQTKVDAVALRLADAPQPAERIRHLLPFVSAKALAQLLAQAPADTDLFKAALPFLGYDLAAERFEAIEAANVTDERLVAMAPFVKAAVLAAHIKRLGAAGGAAESQIRRFLPFLDEATLLKLFAK